METVNISIAIAVIVGIIYPGYAIYGGNKIREMLQNNPDRKIEIFKGTALPLIILSILVLIPFWIDHIGLNSIGLGFILNFYWMTALILCSFIGWYFLKQIKMTPKLAQKVYDENKKIQYILPSNEKEYKWMIFVSFVAGVCEEIIYRGFLYWFLLKYMPIAAVVILANLPFALAHVTSTGFKNSAKAFVLGLTFTVALLLTDSLWLPILLHILVDLYATNMSFKASQQLNLKNTI